LRPSERTIKARHIHSNRRTSSSRSPSSFQVIISALSRLDRCWPRLRLLARSSSPSLSASYRDCADGPIKRPKPAARASAGARRGHAGWPCRPSGRRWARCTDRQYLKGEEPRPSWPLCHPSSRSPPSMTDLDCVLAARQDGPGQAANADCLGDEGARLPWRNSVRINGERERPHTHPRAAFDFKLAAKDPISLLLSIVQPGLILGWDGPLN